MSWAVGDSVLCKGKHAIVRYVGELGGREGSWFGIEFSRNAAGRNDGEIDGFRYFGPTKPHYADFVRIDKLEPYNAEEEAARKLQAQVRRKQEATKTFYAKVCQTKNTLESLDECEVLRASLNRGATDRIMDSAAVGDDSFQPPPRRAVQDPSLEIQRTLSSTAWVEPGVVSTDPSVPRVEIVIGEDGHKTVSDSCLRAILQHLKQPGAPSLTAKCVLALVQEATVMLRREVTSAVCDLSTPEAPGRCVIVGDTHGQLEDVLWLFFDQGEPSESNVYLFNGDVVDRGTRATDIMILILLFKLRNPRMIHMNRGNHEDRGMNECYGFMNECTDKWGSELGVQIYEAFNYLFQHLPICTVIDSSVFVVHGGLFRQQFNLSQLRRVTFRKPVPESPFHGLDIALFDSLWSDPHKSKGIASNSRGDSIVSFGYDVTKKFLTANKLRLVVRSHQLPDDGAGYEWHHQKQCLTVFSASNYCGDCGNLGAVLILSRGVEDELIEHWAPTLDELAGMEAEANCALSRVERQARCLARRDASCREASKQMQTDIVRRIAELVVRHKAELFEYWSTAASDADAGNFIIPASLWREGCEAILDNTLPWHWLQDAMGVVDENGNVRYNDFLARYCVIFEGVAGEHTSRTWEHAFWSKLMETLLLADLPLREALAALDSTNDGLVSAIEFGRLLESCRVDITPLQARALLRAVVTNPTEARPDAAGRANVWDVLGRLQVTLPVTSDAAGTDELSWALPKLKPFAAAILSDAKHMTPSGESWPVSKMLASWFETADSSGNGFLEIDEFVARLLPLASQLEIGGCPSDQASLERLARFCDVTGTGNVNYFELLNSLSWESSMGHDVQSAVLETVNSAIYFNVSTIRHAMRRYDASLTGFLSAQRFEAAFRAAGLALSSRSDNGSLTPSQIGAIVANVAREADGSVAYERFLRSFRVVDTRDTL